MFDKFDNFVGYGDAGCRIVRAIRATCADQNRKYFYIGTEENVDKEGLLVVPVNLDPVQQEKHTPVVRLNALFRAIKGNTLVVLAGTGKIVPSSLRTLEILSKKISSENLNILYVRPEEMNNANESRKNMDRLTFGVLQEYVRSGECARIFVTSNSMMELALDGLSLTNYHEKINALLAFSILSVESLLTFKPVYGTIGKLPEKNRIFCLGVFDVNDGEEKWYYDPMFKLEYASSNSAYLFALNRKSLDDPQTLSRVREIVNNKSDLRNKVSYAVYDAEFLQNDYGFCLSVFDEPLLYEASLNK